MAENSVEPQLQGANAESNNGMTLADLFRTLRKHIITIIVTFVVVVAGVCGLTAMAPVTYSTTAQLFATYNGSGSDANISEQNSGSSYIMGQIKSYPALVTTQSVLQPVIDELHLDTSVGGLAGKINAVNPANTAFINITVTDTNPKQAAEIANTTAQSLSNVVEKSLYSLTSNSSVKLSIVQPAQQPTSPSSPRWRLNIIIGVAAGLILGIFASLLKDLLSRRISDEDEITEYIDAPIVGRIPENNLSEGTSPAVIAEPGSPVAEDYRRIRMNLSFIAPVDGTNCRLIVMSSAGPTEGKTTTSVNMAAALAENGAKVLLIDADLRHPSVANKLDIDGEVGLAHVLSGQASVKDAVQRFWKPNLHVMPAGPKPPNASALLNSPIMVELLNNAMQQYDYVIVDTAPMVVANDAAIFVRHGGAMIMVCRRDFTLKRALRDIDEELRTLEMPVSGIVVTWARDNKGALENSSYYYYYNNRNDRDQSRRRRFGRR